MVQSELIQIAVWVVISYLNGLIPLAISCLQIAHFFGAYERTLLEIITYVCLLTNITDVLQCVRVSERSTGWSVISLLLQPKEEEQASVPSQTPQRKISRPNSSRIWGYSFKEMLLNQVLPPGQRTTATTADRSK